MGNGSFICNQLLGASEEDRATKKIFFSKMLTSTLAFGLCADHQFWLFGKVFQVDLLIFNDHGTTVIKV